MPNPKFSIIIPAYNAESTLRDTVASVLIQGEQDFEVIIVDDGSSDGTLAVMRDLACADWRVRIVSQPNSGVSAARNYGASLAHGTLLAFLDADDQWYANKLQKHRQIHDHDPRMGASYAGVAFCADTAGAMNAGPTKSRVAKGALLATHDIGNVVVENPICTTSNFVVLRDVFVASGGFKSELRYAEDQELLARLVGYKVPIRGIDQTLVKYRISEDGLSCDFEAMLAGWRSFAETLLVEDDFAKAEAQYYRYLARRALRAGAKMTTVRSFVRRGLAADRTSFMSAQARSTLTVVGAYAGGILPPSLRRTVFA